jgi:hypothetical protein
MHKFLMILLMTVGAGAQMLTTDTTDRTTSPAANKVVNMDTLRQSTAVSVKMYGALGNGSTDDSIAIQAALTAQAHVRSGLYFPCGTYITSAQLTLTVPGGNNAPSGRIFGESPGCVTIKYTGSSSITAVLTVTTGVRGYYFMDFDIENLTIEGNSLVTHDLYLVRPSHIHMRKVRLWGANTTSGDCLNVFSGVAGTYDTPSCDAFTDQANAATPFNGVVLDGGSFNDQTTTSTIIAPIIEGSFGGTALYLKNAAQITITSGQIALGVQCLNIASGSWQNTIVNTLFENCSATSYIGGFGNVVQGAVFSGTTTLGGSITIDGRQNKVSETSVQHNTSIASTATFAYLDNPLLGNLPTNKGLGTTIRHMTFSNPVATIQIPEDLDSVYNNPAASPAGINGVETLKGQWTFGTGATLLSPTVFTMGKSWRALFLGKFGLNGACLTCSTYPSYTEFTETANTITAPDGGVITFAVNSSGNFVGSGGSGSDTFQGTIIFMPDISGTTSGANSLQLAGGIKFANGNVVPQVGGPKVNQAACIKAAGPPVVIGYCSSVVSAGGACTCN